MVDAIVAANCKAMGNVASVLSGAIINPAKPLTANSMDAPLIDKPWHVAKRKTLRRVSFMDWNSR